MHTWKIAPALTLESIPDTPPVGSDVTTWIYGPTTGLLDRKQYADGNGTNYSYTSAGRLGSRTWARGVVTIYGYTHGMMTSTNYSDSTPDVLMTYEALGRPRSVSNGLAKSEFSYDPATLAVDKETISYDLDGTAGYEFTRVIDRKQDALLRDVGFDLKNGTTLENQAIYGYSPTDGRLASISGGGFQAPSPAFSYAYLPNSNLLQTITATAGAVHTVHNSWEPNRDVLAAKQNKVGTTVISQYDYIVNAIGQRTNVTQAGTAFAAVRNIDWGYDSLGQVTSADSSINTSDRAYQYDSIGNRQKSADSLVLPVSNNYAANALNQYTSRSVGGSPTLSPVYDLDGNATAYPLPAAPNSNSSLVWDAENRLISSTVNGVSTTYQYDAQSRRIAKTVGMASTLYLYDGWNCITEYTKSGTGGSPVLSKNRLWGLDLSGTLQGAGGVGGLLAESHFSAPQSPIYPTYDGNGNVSEYLSAAGAIAAHFEYDPFGNTVVNTDSSGQFNYKFSTKPLDTETGLYYYGYRYYDPLTGRWPSRDPIMERGGMNLYGFIRNSVPNLIDKLGEKPCGDYAKSRTVGDKKEGRTSKQNNKAIVLNGCGTSGWDSGLVPDSYFWSVFFGDACNNHDGCYGKCGQTQSACDKNLETDMANACKDKYRSNDPNLYVCMAQAATYKNALTAVGGAAFESGQNHHCAWECCE